MGHRYVEASRWNHVEVRLLGSPGWTCLALGYRKCVRMSVYPSPSRPGHAPHLLRECLRRLEIPWRNHPVWTMGESCWQRVSGVYPPHKTPVLPRVRRTTGVWKVEVYEPGAMVVQFEAGSQVTKVLVPLELLPA